VLTVPIGTTPTDPTPTAGRPLRIDVLADSDTRWKWGALLAEIGIRPDAVRTAPLVEHLADPALAEADVLVLAAVGGTVQSALHGMRQRWPSDEGCGRRRRPVVVTGYVGVVYEKLTDGLLLRAGADVVLANSRVDAERFREVYRELGPDPESVVETALPFLGGERYDPAPVEEGQRPYTVCFVAQPSVPADRAGRMHLLRRAAGHARRHPGREVLVKLRSRPGEHTTHLEEFPYQKLLGRLPNLPPNLRTVYGHMGEVLDRTDLCVTVSSTAALESMQRGIPTAVLTDLGIREVLGNHHFTGSGCMTSWDALDAGEAPVARPEWLRGNGVSEPGTDPFVELRARVTRLLDADADADADGNGAGSGLPPLRPYYTPATASGYLPGILARQGLDPDGVPLGPVAQPDDHPARAAARRAVRNGARTVYRTGVQRMAPVIRRWGGL
jgi:hypothetical protein